MPRSSDPDRSLYLVIYLLASLPVGGAAVLLASVWGVL